MMEGLDHDDGASSFEQSKANGKHSISHMQLLARMRNLIKC